MGPTFFTPTPSYEGAGAGNNTPSGGGCPDPLGWLFGWLSVPTPRYEAPASAAANGGLTDAGNVSRDPATPIVLAPSGPVTIVLGADVRFASE